MRRAALSVIFCLIALPLWADALTARLLEALQAPRLVEQLAIEAERSGDDINREFLGGAGGPVLADTVARLNAPERMLPMIEAALTRLLPEETRALVAEFFESPLGQKIVGLELSARATIFDPSIDYAVRQRVAEKGVPPLVAEMIVQGDLIERNVSDAIRVLRQFYLGRLKGGADDLAASEIDAFLDETTESIRFETQGWLEAYMTLAYSPLSEDDLKTYAAFWRTAPGQAFDRALFEAFVLVFEENSFALGQVVGRLEASDEI